VLPQASAACGSASRLSQQTRLCSTSLYPVLRHAAVLQVPLYERGYEKDPAKVAFEAAKAAQRSGIDVLLVDTAGRMQVQRCCSFHRCMLLGCPAARPTRAGRPWQRAALRLPACMQAGSCLRRCGCWRGMYAAAYPTPAHLPPPS
jgi:hypothetical protein